MLKTNQSADTWRAATTITGGNVITCVPGINGANFKLSLPKIEYEYYSSVVFPMHLWGYDCAYGIGFDENVWEDNAFESGVQFDATLTISVLGTNKLHAVFEGQGKTISGDFTDANIFNGESSFGLYLSTNGTNAFTVGVPSFVPHQHIYEPSYDAIGGEVTEKCLCGNIKGVRDFVPSDIDYNNTICGASGDTDFDVSVVSNKIYVKGHNGYGKGSSITLPKIDFNNVDCVEFTLDGYVAYGFKWYHVSEVDA